MQRDGFPIGLHLSFGDIVGAEELSGDIGATDFEPFVRDRELADQGRDRERSRPRTGVQDRSAVSSDGLAQPPTDRHASSG